MQDIHSTLLQWLNALVQRQLLAVATLRQTAAAADGDGQRPQMATDNSRKWRQTTAADGDRQRPQMATKKRL